MGAAQRSALARPAVVVSFSGHVLASFPVVDPQRRLGESVGATAGAAGSARPSRPVRIVRRRHVLPGKKRGELVGPTKRGKGTKILVLVDGRGLPLGATIASASPNEVTLVEPLLERRLLRRRPERLVYDRAADSDPLRRRLARRGVELICPHRRNRQKPPTQDGRSFRRYRRRWKIERSISWLQAFRRLVTRYEYHAYLFQGFVQLACLIIVLRQF
jgi:transposase